jgi:DNA-binding SARP family transcriptional activator
VLPPGSVVDFESVEGMVREAARIRAQGDLAAAAQLRARGLGAYRGELLPEDGPSEWVVAERERLRLLVAGAGLDQAKDLAALGDVDDAIAALTASVRLDRYFDAAWDFLEELHVRAGNSAEALRIRRSHARVVEELELTSTAERAASGLSRQPRSRRGTGVLA